MRFSILIITLCFIGAVIFTAMLRAGLVPANLSAIFEGRERFLYISSVVLAGILLTRVGAPINRWGFEVPPAWRHLGLALVGIVIIHSFEAFGLPHLEGVVPAGPVDAEYEGLEGNVQLFLILLAVSWTFAAFGEEVAFRVIMMRGVAASLGGGALAMVIALLVQAAVFGFVHYYNGGQLAVIRTAFNALIYGLLVLASRGSIWPAVFAHGLHNSINLTLGYLPDE